MPAICGPVVFIVAIIFYLKPPKKINGWYDYRTGSSMKTQERWDFAQRYSARQMLLWTGFYILTAPVGAIINVKEMAALIIAIVLLLVFLFAPVALTERELKKRF